MSRGFQRQPIFLDDKDRLHFLELLEGMVERYNVVLHAYVLMPNHYHLLLQTPHANASRALHWLNTGYSVWFNRHHGRTGALFQARYKSVLIEGEGDWAFSCSVYVHLNPVRIQALGLDKQGQALENAGVVPEESEKLIRMRLEQLRGFVWSSYRAYTGVAEAPGWLMCGTLLARTGSKEPHDVYRHHMEARLGAVESPDDETFLSAPVVGSAEFLAQAGGRRLKALPATGSALPWRRLLPFEAVVKGVEELKGEEWASFVNRHGDWGRDLAFYMGRRRCGLTMKELGDVAGVSFVAVGKSVSRMERRLSENPGLREQFAALEKILDSEIIALQN